VNNQTIEKIIIDAHESTIEGLKMMSRVGVTLPKEHKDIIERMVRNER